MSREHTDVRRDFAQGLCLCREAHGRARTALHRDCAYVSRAHGRAKRLCSEIVLMPRAHNHPKIRYNPQTMYDLFKTTKLLLLTVLLIPLYSHAKIINIPNDFSTIQQGIDEATDGDEIEIEPGTYKENLTLKSNIALHGLETARTIIDAPNSSPAISINNYTNVTIQNLTFTSSTIGIQITNSTSNIIITNNVFALGTRATPNGTAIDVTDDISDVSIFFNTFYGNDIAIDRNSNLSIENNIFSDNTTDIESGLETNIHFNCFDSAKTADSNFGSSFVDNANISFADVGLKDFHLQAQADPNPDPDPDRSCIDLSNASGKTDIIDSTVADAGAYGGDNADPLPYPPQNILLTLGGTTLEPEIKVEWNDNLSYLIGGYKVFYDSDKSGPPYDGKTNTGVATENSPTDVALPLLEIEKVLKDLIVPAPTITPSVISVSPSSQTLDISWTANPNVTSYTLNYGITSVTENTETEITGTNFTITGLTNNTAYQIMVTSHSQPKFYIAVKTYDNTTTATESNFSLEKSINVGTQTDTPSSVVTSIPEEVVAFPNLPGEGCFIATAAFGYYSAPQVQILRDFRDQFLLNNPAGKIFVDWYYRNGPVAAQYLHRYPEMKPIVRALLFPLIYFAKFLLNTAIATQLLVTSLLMILIIIFMHSQIKSRIKNRRRNRNVHYS